MYDDHTAELIITADGETKNIVFVEDLIDAAPSLDNWKFTALKQAKSLEDNSIQMGEYEFNSQNITFIDNSNSSRPDEINLIFSHPDLNEKNHNAIGNGIYIFLDNFLGELKLLTSVDQVLFEPLDNKEHTLNPISKLPEFLNWKEKEFIEKYEGKRKDTENDPHITLEAQTSDGLPLFAVINDELLNWDSKPSHPWIAILELSYSANENGLPDSDTLEKIHQFTNELLTELKDEEGYLYFGSQTSNGIRTLFFACKEFRYSSKVLDLSLIHI